MDEQNVRLNGQLNENKIQLYWEMRAHILRVSWSNMVKWNNGGMISKMRVQLRIYTTSDTWKFLSKLHEALAECKLNEFGDITRWYALEA